LLYTYTEAGFEQDIILREQPPTPASFGLNPDTTTLQVLTEFFNPPQPVVTANTVTTDAGNLEDDFLDFGVMQMIPGKAFLLGTTTPSVAVDKQWLLLDGRQILVEEVPVVSIADELENLPLPQATSIKPNAPLNIVSAKRLLPTQRMATILHKHPMQITQAAPPSRGLVLDYVTMTSQTNYTFQGDTTYYISGTVNLYQTNTFEGGAVLKYANNASVNLESGTVLNWKAAAYRPVIFTAKDDNSVGDAISGSTGNPTNYYANPALSFEYGGTNSLSYFRIAWASQAIMSQYGIVNLYNGQVVNCLNGINATYCPYYLRNLLFANVQTNFNIYVSSLNVQNTTFSGSTCLVESAYDIVSPTLTNCILANVTNLTLGTVPALSGTSNGFYNCQEFGAGRITNSYPFQSVGAGNYYLTNGCAFTNAGTTSIDSTLLASLQQKTTHPPLVYSNATTTTNLTLSPYVQRDTNAAPDLGYHYEPIDYLVDNYTISNATLTVTNGVAVGLFGNDGFVLNELCKFVSVGKPNQMNRLAWYPSVQEQPVNLVSISTRNSGIFNVFGATSTTFNILKPIIILHFTDLPMLGGRQNFFYNSAGFAEIYNLNTVFLMDCWLRGVNLSIQNGLSPYTNYVTAVTLQNNSIERSTITVFNGYVNSNDGTLALTTYNNLYWNSYLGMSYLDSGTWVHPLWTNNDNLFDTATLSLSGNGAYTNYITTSNNGFHNTSTNGIGGVTNLMVTNLTYAISWLGPWYIGSSSPTVVDAGSRNATNAGLYHYTILTNQVPETNSIVDIGYHYVATDTNGIPLDSNGDGIPDYLEDANGDGIVDNGETNWGLAILTQPVSQTVVQGTNVTFSVTADGVAPLSYQWYFNATNLLAGATNSSITISNVQPAKVGGYQMVVTNFSGSLTSSAATLTLLCDGPPSGLVGWWQAESNALDSVGTDNGIVTNGISYITPGEVGTAFNFDGTNGFIQMLNAPDLEPTNLTVEAWVRFSSLYSKTNGTGINTAPPGEQFIVEKPNSYGYDGYVLYIFPNGSGSTNKDYFAFGVNDTNGFPANVGSPTGILTNGVQTNVWYNVAGVRGSNNGTNYIQLYVNGQTSAAWTTNISFQQTYGNYPLFLGSSGGTDPFGWMHC
jgi:hypothetical protein